MSNFGEINFTNVGLRRDIKIERIDKDKYEKLLKVFNLDLDKDLFILAMKVGYLYNLYPDLIKSYGKIPLQTMRLKDKAEMVLLSYKKNKDAQKIFDGPTIIETCEKYANGGIKKLYQLFCESDKGEEIIIENLFKEISKKIK